MRLIPRQVDRSALLLAILYSMALFIPSAWIAMYAFGSTQQAQIYLGVFQALLFLVSAVAGTRRRYLFAIAAWLSVGIAYALSLRHDFTEIVGRTIYHAPGQPELPFEGDFNSGIVTMLVPAVSVFAVSFALSFLFDWLLGPVNAKEKLVADESVSEPSEPKKKSSRFKVLVLLAVPLFLVQTSINASSGAEWMSVAVLVLVAFGVSCRLSFWKGLLALVAFAVAILFTSIQLLAVRMGGDTRTSTVVMIMLGILATLIPVWVLVGYFANRDQRDQRKPGWLSALACILLGSFAWIYVQYDARTLLFGPVPFDFAVARSIRMIDSHPNVRVNMSSSWGRRTQCDIEFKSEEGVDDFFETNPLPDIPFELNISSMPATVNLSPLEQMTVTQLMIQDSRLSSSQLVSLARLQNAIGLYSIGINNCRFDPEDLDWPAKLKPRIGLGDTVAGELPKFFEAVKGLDELSLYIDDANLNEEDYQSVVDALKSKGTELQLTLRFSSAEAAAILADVEDLSNVELHEVELEDEDRNPVRPYLELLFNSKATILANPPKSNQLFWDLAIATKGNLRFTRWNFETTEDYEIPWDMDLQKLRDFHWVYDESESGQPITKLFLPCRNNDTTSKLTKFPELKSLSFDPSWAKAGYNFEGGDVEINLKPLNGIIELKELYMPSYGDRHRLNLLSGQEKLETLQFTASSVGFRESLFPNLKHIILVVDGGALEEDLLRELAALRHLEKVTVTVRHEHMNQSFIADTKQLKKLLEGVLPGVEIAPLEPYETYLPDDFLEHCKRVREDCRVKYLQ